MCNCDKCKRHNNKTGFCSYWKWETKSSDKVICKGELKMTKKVNKSKCKNNECKRLCIRCEYYLERDNALPECQKTAKKVMNCVNGEMDTAYKPCKNINKTGNCSNWVLDNFKDRKERLKNIIKECNGMNGSGYSDIEYHLIKQLCYTLDDNTYSNYFIVFDRDGDTHLCYKYDYKGSYSKEYLEWKKKHEND